MKTIASSLFALALCGCAYPTSSIEQGSELGHLRFTDSAIGRQIVIDGQVRGTVMDNHQLAFDVSPGKHNVQELTGGQVIFSRDYDVSPGATLEIRTVN